MQTLYGSSGRQVDGPERPWPMQLATGATMTLGQPESERRFGPRLRGPNQQIGTREPPPRRPDDIAPTRERKAFWPAHARPKTIGRDSRPVDPTTLGQPDSERRFGPRMRGPKHLIGNRDLTT